MAPYNRVSTILRLLGVEAIYNDASEPTYMVLADGRVVTAAFRSEVQLLPAVAGNAAEIISHRSAVAETCLQEVSLRRDRASADLVGDRLALRVFYADSSRAAVALQVETTDPERRYRDFELHPDNRRAELVDMGANRIRALKITASPGDAICIERMEIGSLAVRRNPL
jgi:hypothetical protein